MYARYISSYPLAPRATNFKQRASYEAISSTSTSRKGLQPDAKDIKAEKASRRLPPGRQTLT